ncbi:threonine/serine exporter family protein [Peptostreptococcus russellii]|uniref:threonine/serine exporter family protein n=1 Tax=Peptostreptococcus russellii TaxID=215200 RepID=UPI000D0FF153|nr:threonine/serine exporter family protein [Peptostreptococcus russellii]
MSIYDVPLWQHFVFSAIATCGFAIFFNVRGKILFYDSIVGGIGWLIYVIASQHYENPMIFSFLAAGFVSLSAEYLARKLKQPAIIIVIPGILPLVPGLGLYNTVYYVIQKEYLQAATVGTRAFITSLGIALGILVMSSMSKVLNLYQLKKAFMKNDSFKYENWVNLGKNRTRNRFILDRKEMNESLNSLNIDVASREREDIEKMERSRTEDFAVDLGLSKNKKHKKNEDIPKCTCKPDQVCQEKNCIEKNIKEDKQCSNSTCKKSQHLDESNDISIKEKDDKKNN